MSESCASESSASETWDSLTISKESVLEQIPKLKTICKTWELEYIIDSTNERNTNKFRFNIIEWGGNIVFEVTANTFSSIRKKILKEIRG